MSGTELNQVRQNCQDTTDVNAESSILNQFNDLFESLGELEGEHHIEINPEVKPVVHASRNVPFTLLPSK